MNKLYDVCWNESAAEHLENVFLSLFDFWYLMCWQSSDSYFPESIFTSVLSLDKNFFIQIILYDCFLLIFEFYVLSSKKHFLSEKRPSESAFAAK